MEHKYNETVLLIIVLTAINTTICRSEDGLDPKAITVFKSLKIPAERISTCVYSNDGAHIGIISSKLSKPANKGQFHFDISSSTLSTLNRSTFVRNVYNDNNNYSGLAFSGDSKRCVVWGARSHVAKILSVKALDVLAEINFETNETAPMCIAFSHDDRDLYFGNRDGSIDLWSSATRNTKRVGNYGNQIGAVTGLKVMPKGGVLAIGAGSSVTISSAGASRQVVGIANGSGRVTVNIAASIIASIHSEGPFASDPKFLAIWKTSHDITSDGDGFSTPFIYPSIFERKAEISSHAISPDGRQIALLTADGMVGLGKMNLLPRIQWLRPEGDSNIVKSGLRIYYGNALEFCPIENELLIAYGGSERIAFVKVSE